MKSVNHNLYEESLTARLSRLEQTIRELKNIIEVSHKINRRQENEIIELNIMLEKQTKLAVKQKQIIKTLK